MTKQRQRERHFQRGGNIISIEHRHEKVLLPLILMEGALASDFTYRGGHETFRIVHYVVRGGSVRRPVRDKSSDGCDADTCTDSRCDYKLRGQPVSNSDAGQLRRSYGRDEPQLTT
jgi:hypothetical protein